MRHASSSRVLIIGAASAIAEAVAREYAQRGARLFLVARNTDALAALAQDLEFRGGRDIGVHRMDANELSAHTPMLDAAERHLGGLDVVLIAYGTLSDQRACERSSPLTVRELMNNAVSVAALVTEVAERLAARRAGTVAVISSVAGDRGRQSNYVYGSAKALVSTFLSGLRQRLRPLGVRVITIKPGFVDTPMTAAFPKGTLWAKPGQVARGIVRAIDRAASVTYLPSFWRPIMFVIRAIPERVFVRLKL